MPRVLELIINGPAYYAASHHISPLWRFVIVIGAFLGEVTLVYAVLLLIVALIRNVPAFIALLLRRFGVGKVVHTPTFLELTFPAETDKSAFATEQLHILLRSQMEHQRFWQKLAGYKTVHSLELVSTRDEGIRYVMMVPAHEAHYVEQSLRSYLPGLKVREVEDYLTKVSSGSRRVAELTLTSDFVFPLQDHKALMEHDLITYLTGHMTKLGTDETMAFQVVVTSVSRSTHHRVMRHVRRVQHRIALGREVSSEIVVQRTPLGSALWLVWYPPLWCIASMLKLFNVVVVTLVDSLLHDSVDTKEGGGKRLRQSPYEAELGATIKKKVDQSLFEVSVRLLVEGSKGGDAAARLEALLASFQPFATLKQGFRMRQTVPKLFSHDQLIRWYGERRLSPHYMSQQTVLSSSELSDLYHFPNTKVTKTEGLVKSRSRELPSPLSMKRSDAELDVVVGINAHGGELQPIGLTLEQRQKHTYILGKTGMGKTTLLKGAIYQDMLQGKGLAVLDPHGDMFQELLRLVPEHRREDVVIFDPSDREWPLGLNLLDPGIDFDNLDDAHEWITSTVISVFAKLADEGFWGPRMEHILRNVTMTSLQLPNPSLYTLQRLLTDQPYQRKIARTLKDPVLKQFWDKEFQLLGTMQLSSITAPLTHRLGHFMTTKMSRHILLQEKSTLRIADIMNEGKILLVNLSKGDIGEDQSAFFGTILTSFIWMAAYQRTKIPERKRRDFFVYVDEFQNFATPRFSEIASEGRKFHVSLIVSHQNGAQIKDQRVVKVLASSASTIICLKVGPEDEAFILPYMRPEVERGDIVNLAPYHFYMKTTSDVSEDAFSGRTLPLDAEESDETKKTAVAYSRKHYGRPKAEVEEYMTKLFKETKAKPQKGASVTVERRKGRKEEL
jgi:hypothetical protein